MSALTLTLREPPLRRIDMSPLTPDRLLTLRREEIAALQLCQGNRRYALKDLFDIEGNDPGTLVIRGGNTKLDAIGAGMKKGRIRIEGHAGNYLGWRMQGGSIAVSGDTGHWTASGLVGGAISVDGNCGDFAGAAQPGDRHGMLGGSLLIRGDAGDRLGDHLRRGLIMVRGNTGSYCAARMTAGTIAVLGSVGPGAGYAMKRGTLLLKHFPQGLPATLGDCGEHKLGFLHLLLNSLHKLNSGFGPSGNDGLRVRRFVGDTANKGNGEILILV